MLKSGTITTILGFTVMALLIMLVSFASMKYCSDAIAAIAVNYDVSQKFMGDSDSYGTDYYYYYYYQQQQTIN